MKTNGIIILHAKQQKTGSDKQLRYVTRPVRYSTLRREELLSLIEKDSGLTRSQVEMGFEAISMQMKQMLLNGHSLELGDIGHMRFVIKCKAVKNKENVSANLVKQRSIRLLPSTHLKEKIKNTSFVIGKIIDAA